MKLSHAFLIAVLANIIGSIIYDYAKRQTSVQR